MPEGKVYRLKAPEKTKGTNWREHFYNEVVPVRDRIAEVRRPMNAEDLKRRGWTEVGDGKKEKKEEKKGPPKTEEKKDKKEKKGKKKE